MKQTQILPALSASVMMFVAVDLENQKCYVDESNINNPLLADWVERMGNFNEFSAAFTIHKVPPSVLVDIQKHGCKSEG